MLVGHKGVGSRRQHCGGDGEEQSLDHPSAGFVPVRPSDRVVGVGEDPGGQPECGFPSGGERVWRREGPAKNVCFLALPPFSEQAAESVVATGIQ